MGASDGAKTVTWVSVCVNTVKAVAAFPEVVELNIGHFLVGEGIFVGLDRAVAQMRAIIAEARGQSLRPVTAVAT